VSKTGGRETEQEGSAMDDKVQRRDGSSNEHQASQSEPAARDRAPHWERWGSMVEATLSQAVALWCDLDPDGDAVRWLGQRSWESPDEPIDISDRPFDSAPSQVRLIPREFFRRLSLAINHVRGNKLAVTSYTSRPGPSAGYGSSRGEPRVDLAVFAEWAMQLPKPWPLPLELREASTSGAAPTRSDENKLERAARVAKEKFQRDRANGNTWPTDDEGTTWLLSKDLVANASQAQVVLRMIRPDDLKPGPRQRDEEIDDE
jgi:hypothetical protein